MRRARMIRVVAVVCASSALVGCALIAGFGDEPTLGVVDSGDATTDGNNVLPDGALVDHAVPSSDAPVEDSAGCLPNQIRCGGNCIDPSGDPANCGTCGHACANGYACKSGICDNAVVGIAAGDGHACARIQRGDVYCWGNDVSGQVGNGDAGGSIAQATFIPRDDVSSTVGSVVALAAGRSHSCALKSDGTSWCWGSQVYGQLSDAIVSPDGGAQNRTLPHAATQSTSIFGSGPQFRYSTLGLGSEADHGCATTGDSGVVCWGNNDRKQLWHDAGLGLASRDCNGSDCSPLPYPVGNIPAVKQVAVGSHFSCALDNAGTFWCWGDNFDGELANGSRGNFIFGDAGPSPNVVQGIVDGGVGAFIATGDSSACAVLADGTVWCWGDNVSGQLGHDAGTPTDLCCNVEPGCGGGNYCTPTAHQVGGLSGAATVGVGCSHACAMKSDGTVWCWGANDKGQLGTGDNNASPSPRQVQGMSSAVGIALGCNHSCAWKSDGTAWCWGLNANSQLANGVANTNAPAEVQGLPK